MNIVKLIASRLLSAVRLMLGFALLAPLPLLMIYFNYDIDSSGFLRGDLYLREVANMVLAGEDIVGYNNLTAYQRDITKILANEMNPLPDVVAFGSSRILQLSQEVLNRDAYYGTFFNCGITGGDIADVLGSFYLFDKVDRLPKTVVIGFDPWLLRDGEEAMDSRSDRKIYAEFLTEKLGIPTDYEKTDSSEKWEALFSLAYFQENVAYSRKDETGENKPVPVSGNLYEQATDVKRGDGSLLYEVGFRTRSMEERESDAWFTANNQLRMTDYPRVDTSLNKVWENFFEYAKARGVKVILMLTPYHPMVWDFAQEHPEQYGGFLQTEAAIRRLAEKHEVSVLGSYNPYNIPGVDESDFYDGLHCAASALEKILWGDGAGDVDSNDMTAASNLSAGE